MNENTKITLLICTFLHGRIHISNLNITFGTSNHLVETHSMSHMLLIRAQTVLNPENDFQHRSTSTTTRVSKMLDSAFNYSYISDCRVPYQHTP